MDKLEDTLLVGISFSEKDTGVLIVGRKRKDHGTDIVNAFQGEEALELYKKLITKKGEINNGRIRFRPEYASKRTYKRQ